MNFHLMCFKKPALSLPIGILESLFESFFFIEMCFFLAFMFFSGSTKFACGSILA
jgi:hypothetical protein